MSSNKKKSEYIEAARAGSRLRFNPMEQLEVTTTIKGDNCLLKFQTLYVEAGFETPIPMELWIEARGPASSIGLHLGSKAIPITSIRHIGSRHQWIRV